MSRFRILVESLVESIYEEGLGIEEARLIALYEDAVTNGYKFRNGEDKEDSTVASWFTEELDKAIEGLSIEGYEVKVTGRGIRGNAGNGKSFYGVAYVEVPYKDFDPMPVELIFRSSDHSKIQSKSDSYNQKNIDVLVPDDKMFASGANKDKYTKNPNDATNIPKQYIMRKRDPQTKEVLPGGDYYRDYIERAVEQIKSILKARVIKFPQINIDKIDQLPEDFIKTHPLFTDWFYRYKKLQRAKEKAAELDKAALDSKPEAEKPKSDRPVLSLNTFKQR